MAVLRPTDHLFTTYRGHGYALARGADPGREMAALFGRASGLTPHENQNTQGRKS